MSGEWLEEGRAPVILDYEYHESKRLPVDVGAGITLSGAITLDAGDIQIGAVEIKNASTNDRAVVTAVGDVQVTLDSEVVDVDATGQGDVPITLGGEIVQVSGIMSLQPGVVVDTELPAAAVLTDNQDQAVPVVGAYLMGLWDDEGDTEWRRARLLKYALYDDEDPTQFDDSLITQTIIRGLDGNNFSRIRGTPEYGLEVDVTRINTPITISGTVQVESIGISGITVLRAPIDASSLGANELVAAVGGEKIKVLSMLLIATDTVSGIFRSNSGGSLLAGNLSLDALGAGFLLTPPADPSMHWFETDAGEALVLELGSAIAVGGLLTYYTE